MKKRTRILAALAAAALLVGCGASDSGTAGYQTENAAYDSEYAVDAAGGADSSLMPDSAATDENAQKIIYNADLSMESTDFDAARETLLAAVDANDAWLEYSSIDGAESDHDRTANFTVRVPVENYRSFLAAAGDAGSVQNLSENAQNITSSYIDVQARLTALEAQRDRLNELADEAETTADLLEIESQLSDVQYQLENYTRQLRSMDQQVLLHRGHLPAGGRRPDAHRRDLHRAHRRCLRQRLGRVRRVCAGAYHRAGLPVAGRAAGRRDRAFGARLAQAPPEAAETCADTCRVYGEA